MDDDDRLVRLAADIADGADVSWSAVEAHLAGEDRELAHELRLLQQVAEVHTRSEPARAWLPPGAGWGSLRIVERIGGGTFGEVYRAFDPRLDREVALKLLHPPSPHQSPVETLPASAVVEEGRLMARVRHPGVVTVHGAERVGGQVGLWMELIDGRTLAQEVDERGPLPLSEVQQIGVHLAEALAAVHHAGVLHRDVKAQNVMRERGGRIVLMDFGTGLDLRDGATTLAGTPLYLAPEVLAGKPATAQSDIYSLGVLLFYLATGEFVVRGETLGAVREAHARGGRQSVHAGTRVLPRALARVIERAIAVDPSARYESAQALAAALRETSPEVRRQRMLVVAGVLVLVTAAGLSIATLRSRPAAPSLLTGIVEQQIDVALQAKAQIRGPAVGEWIPCHPRQSGGIALCNLSDGSIRPLRMPAERGERSPVARARLSSDGRWLAYQWQTPGTPGPLFSVNLIAADGSSGRELQYRTDKRLDIQGWTTGDEAIVVREVLGPDRQRLLLLPASGAPYQELLAVSGLVTRTDLSPDGRSVLVTRLVAEQHDVALIDVATGAERWVIGDRTDDHSALWTPDGGGVVFISDRTGCDGLAFMPIEADGSPGAVTIVKDLGRNSGQPFGFSPDGSYLLQLDYARRTAYRAPIDLERRTAGAAVPLVARCKEQSTGAGWHPRTPAVAFLSGGLLFGDAHVVIQTMTGRIERELATGGRFALFGRVRWSLDGRTLAIRHSGPRGNDVLSLLDVAAGERREIARGTDQSRDDDKIREVRWSPDGRTLFYQRDNTIRGFDSVSGNDASVYRYTPVANAVFAGFDVRHSDGALVIQEPIDESRCRIRVRRGGQLTDRGEVDGTCTAVAWSHDGTRILAATLTNAGQLWVFDHEGGEPWQLPLPSDVFWDLSVSPDGRELLFSAGNPRPNMVMLRGLSAAR